MMIKTPLEIRLASNKVDLFPVLPGD